MVLRLLLYRTGLAVRQSAGPLLRSLISIRCIVVFGVNLLGAR